MDSFTVTLKAYKSKDSICFETTNGHEAWCKYNGLKKNFDNSKHISLEIAVPYTALMSDGSYKPCLKVLACNQH